MRLPYPTLLILVSTVFATVDLAAQSSPSSHEREASVRVITSWTSACSASSVSAWDNMLDGWFEDITDGRGWPFGHHSKAWNRDTFKVNGSIVDSDFTDSSRTSFGNDEARGRIDEADAFMLGLHGGEAASDDHYYGKVRVNEPGAGNCYFFQDQMLFDRDLEFLHLSSCHSMCDDNYRQWIGALNRCHLITGFHGIMWISTSFTSRYRRFSADSFRYSIAEAWIDNHHSVAGRYDHCPTSFGVGNSVSNLWSRMENEEYDRVYPDPSTTASRWYGIIYIEDCDPLGDSPIFD